MKNKYIIRKTIVANANPETIFKILTDVGTIGANEQTTSNYNFDHEISHETIINNS